jgi:hypothetical protein
MLSAKEKDKLEVGYHNLYKTRPIKPIVKYIEPNLCRRSLLRLIHQKRRNNMLD